MSRGARAPCSCEGGRPVEEGEDSMGRALEGSRRLGLVDFASSSRRRGGEGSGEAEGNGKEREAWGR